MENNEGSKPEEVMNSQKVQLIEKPASKNVNLQRHSEIQDEASTESTIGYSYSQSGVPIKDNVKVMIRVRPFNDREKGAGGVGSKKCVLVDNMTTITLDAKPENKVFSFDFVGDEELSQKIIFTQIARPIADYCLEGYNGSIFAYGQTGSGKTFTILGPTYSLLSTADESSYHALQQPNLNSSVLESDLRGLMPRSFEYIFECIETAKSKATKSNDHYEYLVRCSYLEIYNEQIMDLLEPGSINLHIREDIKKGVYVEGLVEENIFSANDMMDLIAKGAKNRHMGSTLMNKESSRSHSVLTTIIETKSMTQGGVWNIKTSRFHIIDLAGSERAKNTNAMGDRLKEAGMINKSLSALGNVINSLVDISEGKNRHVHYRDSKLTFLLRDSLGGNSKTVIIANISPSAINSGETLSTLKFAQRAKLIKNKAIINEDSSGTIQLLKSEIGRLKKELAISEQRITSQSSIEGSKMVCVYCRNNINDGDVEDQNYDNEHSDIMEDSLLIDSLAETENTDQFNKTLNKSLNSTSQLKQTEENKKYTNRLRQRVIYLENLLAANLDNMNGQQKYYENETQNYQSQIKKLQASLDSYEKQGARDKMIIKFREDRISKLEQSSQQPNIAGNETLLKQIEELKKEVQVWKEGVEHNAQAAKLFAEKAEIQNLVENLKKELGSTPDSLQVQIHGLTELNESLNEYLKQYCEEAKEVQKVDYESQLKTQQQMIENQNTKIHEIELNEQNSLKIHSQNIELMEEKISQLNQQIVKIIQENQQSIVLINDQNEREIDVLKQQIINLKDQIKLITKQNNDISQQLQQQREEYEKRANNLVQDIELFKQQIEQARNDNLKLQNLHETNKSEQNSLHLAEVDKLNQEIERKSILVQEQISINQQIIEDAQQSKSSLQTQIIEINQQLEQFQGLYNEQMSLNKMMCQQNIDEKSKIQTVNQEELERLQHQIKSLTQQIAQLESTNREISIQFEEEKVSYSTKINDLSESMQALEKLKEEQQFQIDNQTSLINQLQEKMISVQAEKLSFISLSEQQERNHEIHVNELIQKHSLKIEQYQTEINDYEQQLQLQKAENNSQQVLLSQQASKLQENQEIKEQLLAKANHKITQLEQDLIMFNEKALNQNEVYDKEQSSLTSQLQDQYQKVDSLKNEINQLNLAQSKQKDQNNDLRQLLEEESSKNKALSQQVEILTVDFQNLQFEQNQQNEKDQYTIKELESQKVLLTQQIELNSKKLDELNEEKSVLNQRTSIMNDKLQGCQQDLQIERERSQKLLEDYQKTKMNIDNEVEQRTISIDEKARLKKEELNLKIKEQEIKIEELENQYNCYKSLQDQKLTKLIDAHSQDMEGLNQSSIQQLNEMKNQLNDQIEDLQNKQQNKTNTLLSQIKQLKEYINQIIEENVNQTEIIKSQAIQEKKELIEQMKQKISQTLQDTQDQIQDYKSQFEILQQDHEQAIKQIEANHAKILTQQEQSYNTKIDEISQGTVREQQEIVAQIEEQNLTQKVQLQQKIDSLNQQIVQLHQKSEDDNQQFLKQLDEEKLRSEQKLDSLKDEMKLQNEQDNHKNAQKLVDQKQQFKEVVELQTQQQQEAILTVERSFQNKIKEAEREVENYQQVANRIQVEKNNEIQELIDQIKKLEIYKNKSDGLEKNISQIREQQNTLTSQLLNVTMQKAEVESKLSQQENQMKQSIEAHSIQLTQASKTKAVEFEKVIKQLQVTQEQKLAIEQSKSELQEMLEMKEQALDQINQDLEDLNNQRVEEEQLKLDALDQLKESQDQCEELSQQINNLMTEIKTVNQSFSDFKQEQSNNKQIRQLVQEVENQKKVVADQQQMLHQKYTNQIETLQNEYSVQSSQLKQDIDNYKTQCKELSTQLVKLKQRSEDQNDMLKSSKETISSMVQKENELMKELEKKINELKDHQDKWKKRVQDARDEKDSLRKDWERYRKENENLRELIKLKERQIDELQGVDDQYRDQMEKVQKENKELRSQITKREFEMKEVVRTLKFYSEEKIRLEKDLERAIRENDSLIGHNNPSQKIQHHLKIKEENNKLRDDNARLIEEIKKKNEYILKGNNNIQNTSTLNKSALRDLSPLASNTALTSIDNMENLQTDGLSIANQSISQDELKRLKKENSYYQETINKLVEHVMGQSGLMKTLGLSEEMKTKLQQQTGSSRVKNAIELITLVSNMVQVKEQDIKDLAREKIRVECKLEIMEKEKNQCKAQLEQIQQSNKSPISSNKNISQHTFLSNNNINNNNTSLFPPKSPIAGSSKLTGSSYAHKQDLTPTANSNNSAIFKLQSLTGNNKQQPNGLQQHQYPSASRLLNITDSNNISGNSLRNNTSSTIVGISAKKDNSNLSTLDKSNDGGRFNTNNTSGLLRTNLSPQSKVINLRQAPIDLFSNNGPSIRAGGNQSKENPMSKGIVDSNHNLMKRDTSAGPFGSGASNTSANYNQNNQTKNGGTSGSTQGQRSGSSKRAVYLSNNLK